VDAWFSKGAYAAAYSGFEGGTDLPDGERAGLADWLRKRGVAAVDVVGIATDHCVRATALDAVTAGFDTRVLLDLTAGVAPQTTAAAIDQLTAAGADLVGTPVGG
jgi:nicotinamidase/pyrazinamidase